MPERKAMLAKIHIARKDLGLDDETYRAIITRIGNGKTSSRDLTIGQMDLVLREFTGKGWRPKQPKKGKKPHNFDRLPGYVTKVEALLADMGLSWAYADSIARNITGGNGAPERNKEPGVDRLAWVKDPKHWQAIITALVIEQTKRFRYETITNQLARLGRDESYVIDLLTKNKRSTKNWNRNSTLMGQLIDVLQAQIEQIEAGETT